MKFEIALLMAVATVTAKTNRKGICNAKPQGEAKGVAKVTS